MDNSIQRKWSKGGVIEDFLEDFLGQYEDFLFLFIFSWISDFFEASHGDFIRTIIDWYPQGIFWMGGIVGYVDWGSLSMRNEETFR